jgi:hypothetical protein
MTERAHPDRRSAPTAKPPSLAVTRLIDRIRRLVAEQRRLEARGDGKRLKAYRVEFARLQRQLETAVRRELSEPGTE